MAALFAAQTHLNLHKDHLNSHFLKPVDFLPVTLQYLMAGSERMARQVLNVI